MAEEDQPQFARPAGSPSSGATAADVDPTVPSGSGSGTGTASTTGATDTGEIALTPSVLAVVVTHDPGPGLEETLTSLAAQDYPRLAVLVVDAASNEDPTPRIKSVLPDAMIVRRDEDEGFGAAANVVLEEGPRAALYLFCHDDVALQPDAVSRLVEEVLRSNAAIVGPKMVDWDDPSRLRDVGLLVDKFGVAMSAVEEGELDQEQHDALTDVFAVPGGCTMVRADLFRTIGGYDPGISLRGDDVDLCWRAQLAGARVMVVPAAVVRHHGQLSGRREVDDTRRLRMRHQLRTLLSVSSFTSLVRVVPQAFVLAVAEIVLAVVRGRIRHAGDVASAWTWNLRRLPEIRRRRKEIKQFRQVSDSEVHQLHVRGSVRLRAFLRGQIGRRDVGGLAASGRHLASSLRNAPTREALIVLTLLALVILVGSRHLLTRSVPAVGELAPLTGGTGELLDDWWRGWHTRAMGTSTPAPTAFAILGLAGIPLLGNAGLLRTVLALAPLPLAAVGIWRLVRPFASQRGTVVGTLAYLANPVPYNAYARGAWSVLVAYAAAPWLFAVVARTLEARPFHRATRTGGSFSHRVLGVGMLLALITAFVPFGFALLWVLIAGIVIGSFVAGDGRGTGRLVAVGALATVVAFVLHLPWSTSFVRGSTTWASFVGQGSSEGNGLGVGDLLRFHNGPMGGKVLGYGLVVAACAPLLLAHGPRLAWAMRCWFAALAAWALVWVGEQGWLGRPLPDPGVTLALAAAALAVSAGIGVAAFESDLRRHRFGWRQLLPVTTALAIVAIAASLVGASVNGRWKMPQRDFTSTFESFAGDPSEGRSRVLWLGDREVLPLAGYALGGSVELATTDAGGPAFTDRWGGPETAGIPIVRDAVNTAVDGNTSRLGRLLAPFAIRYVVVVESRAPGAPPVAAPEALTRALASQLDLEPVAGVDRSLTVYRNSSWAPMHTVLPEGMDGAASGIEALVRTDLSGLEPALTDHDSDGIEAEGAVPDDSEVYVATNAAPDWRLVVDGEEAPRHDAFGWANAFRVDDGGEASLRYDTPLRRHVLLAGQLVLWVVAWVVLGNLRSRRAPVTGKRAA